MESRGEGWKRFLHQIRIRSRDYLRALLSRGPLTIQRAESIGGSSPPRPLLYTLLRTRETHLAQRSIRRVIQRIAETSFEEREREMRRGGGEEPQSAACESRGALRARFSRALFQTPAGPQPRESSGRISSSTGGSLLRRRRPYPPRPSVHLALPLSPAQGVGKGRRGRRNLDACDT